MGLLGACRRSAARWAARAAGEPLRASSARAETSRRAPARSHFSWTRPIAALAPPPGLSRDDATSSIARRGSASPPRDASAPRGARSFAAPSAAIAPGHVSATSPLGDHAPVNPFGIVNDELAAISDRMRSAVTTEVPALATAAEYFFRVGSEGKRMRPTVLLLLASSLTSSAHYETNAARTNPASASAWSTPDHAPADAVPDDTRRRQQRVAEVTELIHVASLLHDDVLDGSATRRGLRALNLEVGNKLAILAGDFLLARASVTLASLRNTEVIELLSKVLEHLVTGEVMQMTAKKERLTSFDHYFQKTYFKTASLIANSAKAIVLLGGHDKETAHLAYEYGRHLGLAFQFQDDVLDFVGVGGVLGKPTLGDLREGIATAPALFAAEEHPELVPLIERRFKRDGDVERAAELVRRSDGVERTKALAREHAAEAAKAVENLPPIECPHAVRCRRGLVELARMAVDRIK